MDKEAIDLSRVHQCSSTCNHVSVAVDILFQPDGDGLDTCADCHQSHCQRQPYDGQRVIEGDVVTRKKHGDGQWRKR